ncbi:amino acid ABC transporter permease [Glutamicibacter uratoxydans]|uniref:amino acid ABC transporter permease n=1 Tax=Glutamicibacter uratoxydans TaxID=43667 RepID=UPI003D6DD484
MTKTVATSKSVTGTKPNPQVHLLEIVPRKRYGQWATAVVLLIFSASLALALAQNENIHYATIAEFFAAEAVLKGLVTTFQLTAIGMLIGLVVGVLVAVAKMSENKVLKTLAELYIWIFRGVPLLVQILILGNFALLFPKLGVGIPFTDIMFFSVDTNIVITTFVAGALALGLHEGAYMAEIVRGGILGVDQGQEEAAIALGMTGTLAMGRIILPQAMRIIIPPTGNQFISLLKASSLIAIISGHDLMSTVQNISAQSYRTIEMLLVASLWYLIVVTVLNILQSKLEKRLSRSVRRK